MGKLLLLLLILPFSLQAQQIKVNEVDGFTGQRTIETSIVSLRAAFASGIGISLSSVGDHYLVNIVGYGNGPGPVRKNDFVYFLMEDRLIITAGSIGEQPANDGSFTKVFQHHYLVRIKDLKDLASKKTLLLRVTTSAGNKDIQLSKRDTKEIMKLSKIFLNEVVKNQPAAL